MTDTQPGKWINVHLTPDLLQDLDALKAHFGIKSSPDMLRYLVRRQARQLAGAPCDRPGESGT